MSKERFIYIWDSSIPEKWREIAGNDHFIHISQSNKAKNTLEFLTETQRYIHNIRTSEAYSLLKKKAQRRKLKYNSTRLLKKKIMEDEHDQSPTSHGKVEGISYPSFGNSEENKIVPTKLPDLKKPNLDNMPGPLKSISNGYLLKYNHDRFPYIKLGSKKKPEFICLPKALQANHARIMRNFSPERYY